MKKFNTFSNCIKLVTILSCCKNSNAWLPYVVTRFEGLEQFYLDVSRRSPILIRQTESSSQSDIDVNTKWHICQNIFVHNFQHYDHPFAILLDPSQHETYLRDEYPDIFREIFVERLERPILPGIHALNSLKRPSHPYHELVNASKERTISIDGVEHAANVFSCLVQEFVSKWVRQYFVSRDEYNVNAAPDEDPLAGRFVFSFGIESHHLVLVHSLVEEYPIASIYSQTDLRTKYFTGRANNPLADGPEDDPICNLDAGRKVRLCSAVLRLYQTWRKFTITVRGECERKRFAFPRSSSYLRPFWDTKFWNAPLETHEEWMFECTTVPHERRRVFVSRSYNNNEVFVYENNDTGPLWMTRSTAKVGVVHDRAANRRQKDRAEEIREERKVDEHSNIGGSTN